MKQLNRYMMTDITKNITGDKMKRYTCKECGVKQKIKDKLLKVSFKGNQPIYWARCVACRKEVEMGGSKD